MNVLHELKQSSVANNRSVEPIFFMHKIMPDNG